MRISRIETNYNAHNQNQPAYKANPFKNATITHQKGNLPAKVGFWGTLTAAISKLFNKRAPEELNPKSFEEQKEELNPKSFEEQKEELFTEFKTESPEEFDAMKQNPNYWNFLERDIDEVPNKEDLKKCAQLIKEDPETLNKTLKALNEYDYCFPGNKVAQCNLPGLLRCAEFMKNSPKQTEKLLKDIAPKYVGGEKPSFKTLDAFLGFVEGLIIALDTKAKSYYPSKEEQQKAYSSLAGNVHCFDRPPKNVVFDNKLLKSESCAYFAAYMNELLEYKDIRQLILENKDSIFEFINNDKIFDTNGIDLFGKFSYVYYSEYLWRTCG